MNPGQSPGSFTWHRTCNLADLIPGGRIQLQVRDSEEVLRSSRSVGVQRWSAGHQMERRLMSFKTGSLSLLKCWLNVASSGSCGGRSGTALTESSLPLVEGYHVRWTLDFVRKACKSCVLNHHCQHAGLINLLWLVLTSRHLYSF